MELAMSTQLDLPEPIERPLRRAASARRRLIRRLRTMLRRHGPSIGDHAASHWERLAARLIAFGGASHDNAVELFTDGDELFDTIWRDIAGASSRVWLETYTIEPDRVGTRTIAELAAAAARGCSVVLLYDAVGSSKLSTEAIETLRAAGCSVMAFNPIWRWRRNGPLLCRDHRKILVIDDRIGYCGGMNLSEDYAGHRHGRGTFRDCHLRLQGRCVPDLGQVFRSSLAYVLDDSGAPGLGAGSPRAAGPTFVQVLGSSGLRGRRTVQRAVRATIRRALHHCWITTPYFVPPLRLARAIIRAAKRGVDVRILTPGPCDVPIVRMAAQHVYAQFLQHGVRIFELQDCMLHAKSMTIDGLYSTVGSFNLDHWSDKHNLEVNVGMIDPAIAKELEQQFTVNVASAREITLDMLNRRTVWQRFAHWLMYQFLRL